MRINQREAAMMDLVLEAFDENERLLGDELLMLFDDDRQQAVRIVDLLISTGMIRKLGFVGAGELPLTILREPQALELMQNGGFTEQYQQASEAVEMQPEKAEPVQPETTHIPELPKAAISNQPVSSTTQDEQQGFIQRIREKDLRIRELEIEARTLKQDNERLKYIKGFIWLLGILCAILAIWIVILLNKHHK